MTDATEVPEGRAELAAWASGHNLYFRETSFALPEATQLLRHGFMKEVTGFVRGDLPGDLADSWLAHVSYVYAGHQRPRSGVRSLWC